MRTLSLSLAAVILLLNTGCGGGAGPEIDLEEAKALALQDARTEFAERQLRNIRVTPGPVTRSGETIVANGGGLTILGLELDVSVRGPNGTMLSPTPYRWEYHPTTGMGPGDEATVLLGRRLDEIPGASTAPAGSTYAVRLRKAWIYDSGETVALDPIEPEEKARLDLLMKELSVAQQAELDAHVNAELEKLEPLTQRAEQTVGPPSSRGSLSDTDRDRAAVRRREAQRSEAARLRAEERSRRRDADQVARGTGERPQRREPTATAALPAPRAASPKPASPAPEDVAFLGWWQTCRGEIGHVVTAARELSTAARKGSFASATGERRKFVVAVNKAVSTHDAHPPSPMDDAVDTLLTSFIDAAKALQSGRYVAYESRMETAIDQLKQIDSLLRQLLHQPG